MQIYNFNNCQSNLRTYGGMAGSKLGIIFNNENWFLKFPKNTKSMKVDDMSYTTAPLSEYIGSHVYEILNFDVQETILGIKDEKIVVACKDFLKSGDYLQEFRELANYYDSKLEAKLEEVSTSSSTTLHKTPLEDMLIHFKYNELIKKNPEIISRFWDCVIVDGLINNNDRNAGNWGIIRHSDNTRVLSPVYDNGDSFSDEYTAYSLNNKILSFQDILNLDNKDLRKSLIRLTPLILDKIPKIKEMIENIPNTYKNIQIISEDRKLFYIKGMEERLNKLILPAYNKVVKIKNSFA